MNYMEKYVPCICIKSNGEKLDFSGLYETCDNGNVKSLNYAHKGKNQILKTKVSKNGYKMVCLFKDGKRHYCRVNRVVASSFQNICGNYFNGAVVDHLNTIKTDDRALNLKWVTNSQNHLNPLTRKHKSNSKINRPDQSKCVVQISFDGEIIKEFLSTKQAERELGFNSTNIQHCCKGRRHSAYGYIWKYKKDCNN